MHRPIRNAISLVLTISFFSFSAAHAAMATAGQFDAGESGAATYSIPILAAPGTAGIEPKLALTYNSQGSNGLLGVGWSLSGLSLITRCPQTMAQDGAIRGVNYDANDRYCLNGERLIAISGSDGAHGTEYRTERESFAKIVSYVGVAGSGPSSFQVWTKSGQLMQFGATDNSRIEAQGQLKNIVWALNKIQDTKGNYLTATYTKEPSNGNFYPQRIDYTGNAAAGVATNSSVQFQYAARPDIATLYQAGSLTKNTVRLSNVKTYAGTTLVKDYRLQYGQSTQTNRSVLTSATECEGAAGICLLPVTFDWSFQSSGFFGARWETKGGGFADAQQWFPADVNGDGLTDFVNAFDDGGLTSIDVHLNTGSGYQLQRWETKAGGFSGTQKWFVVDMNGDGLPDLVNVFNDGGSASVDVHLNTGSGFQMQRWETKVGGFWDTQKWFVVDMNGDGRPDLVNVFNDGGSTSIDVHLNTGSGFQTQRWETKVGGFWDKQKMFMADVNGDGLPDLVNVFNDGGSTSIDVHLNTGTGFRMQRWETKAGGFWDTQKIFMADVNGDGLPDLVNVFDDGGSASIDVHLNTGSGFQMQRWETKAGGFWDKQKWFVSDVNGDGRADLVNVFDDGGSASIDVHLSSGTSFQGQRWETKAGGFWDAQKWFMADVKGEGAQHPVNVFADGGLTSIDAHNHVNAPADRIVAFSVGSGKKTSVVYAPLTQSTAYTKDGGAQASSYPVMDLQMPLYVVSSSVASNGIGGTNTTNYKYGGMKADLKERGLLGFRWFEATQLDTGITTRTEYRQDWPYVGMPSLIKKTAGGVFNQVSNTYGCNDFVSSSGCTVAAGRRYFPFVSQSVESSWDLNGAALPVVTTSAQYDAYGNATEIGVSTSDGFTRKSVNTYINDTANWFLGRLTRATVTNKTP